MTVLDRDSDRGVVRNFELFGQLHDKRHAVKPQGDKHLIARHLDGVDPCIKQAGTRFYDPAVLRTEPEPGRFRVCNPVGSDLVDGLRTRRCNPQVRGL